MSLDEAKEEDLVIEEKGITFVMDPFATNYVTNLIIDMGDDDGFFIYDSNVPKSSC